MTTTTNPRLRRSPWGSVDHQLDVAPGIALCSTPSHGGVHLDEEHNAQVPAAFRNPNGWYEEDCELNIAIWLWPEAFTSTFTTDVEVMKAQAADSLREWFPDQWAAMTGEVVTAEQSSIIAEREFSAAHAEDYVSVAAWGSWHDAVPKGKVGIMATLGGRRESGFPGARYFLVDEGLGAGRGTRFVIDLERDTEVEGWT
jgi:hypothetical protein